MFEMNSCFACAKDFVVLEVLLSLTDRKLEDTYVAFFRNTQRVSLTKMLVGMYVNLYIFFFYLENGKDAHIRVSSMVAELYITNLNNLVMRKRAIAYLLLLYYRRIVGALILFSKYAAPY